jgi:hypothetical protein
VRERMGTVKIVRLKLMTGVLKKSKTGEID